MLPAHFSSWFHATSNTSLRPQVPCVVLRSCHRRLRMKTPRSSSQRGDKLFEAAVKGLPGPLASALRFAELDDPCTLRFYPRWKYEDLIACKNLVGPSEIGDRSIDDGTGLVDSPYLETCAGCFSVASYRSHLSRFSLSLSLSSCYLLFPISLYRSRTGVGKVSDGCTTVGKRAGKQTGSRGRGRRQLRLW